MRVWRKINRIVCLGLLIGLSSGGLAAASQSSSASYQLNEVFFGSGGSLSSCSASYCTKQSAGETGVGNTSSADYQAQAGFNTDRTPYIQMLVNTTSIDLGVLHSGVTSTASATFSVKTYLASGYVVTTASTPPKNGSYTLAAPSSPTASNPATEQFGINLVANNACGGGMPGSLGSNPVQVPSSVYSFGAAASGYNTACQFKYVNGDTVASSSKSSGETDYTISYIFNITGLTAGGTYTMNHVLVATSTY
ncbi:MAG TPA: hypothetical protein VLG13_01805 [Patescibacteria group bacterium]|nr:hypothetical protein [Patescibacteria group bacterium]